MIRFRAKFKRRLVGLKEKSMAPLINAINKIKSLPRAPQPAIPSRELRTTFIGSMLGIGVTAALAFYWDCPMLLGPFGATAVLVYGAYKAPLAQPRNVLLGHFLGAVMGVAVYDFFGTTWWSLALGVTLTIIFMMVTYSMHPPAGATAYVAIQTGGLGVGYAYIINPVLLGAVILLVTAIIINKVGKRDYPASWW
jgi:CBS-domain-containing membrane protein